jgi:hypothetical protein
VEVRGYNPANTTLTCWTPNDGFYVRMTPQGRVTKGYWRRFRRYRDKYWADGLLSFGENWKYWSPGFAQYGCQSRRTGLTCANHFASLLIAQGANVVFVSRQIGHASVATTLNIYAHLFDGAEHAESTSAKREASFGNVLETKGGNQPQSEATAASGEVVSLQALSD